MTRAAELCRSSSLKYGVDEATVCDPDDYKKDHPYREDTFSWMNTETLEAERGCGYWLWKPWVIADAMYNKCEDGDSLIYADAGVEFVAYVQEIISRMDQDIFFFSNGWPHYDWCKRKVLDAILPNWKDWWTDRKYMPQVQASVIFFKVNQQTRDFVKEWLLWSQMPGFIDDSPSKEGESEQAGFQEHRHDQSILTCLAYKYGYRQRWWPTQYSMHLIRSEKDDYPCMFNHHRKRNNEWQ